MFLSPRWATFWVWNSILSPRLNTTTDGDNNNHNHHNSYNNNHHHEYSACCWWWSAPRQIYRVMQARHKLNIHTVKPGPSESYSLINKNEIIVFIFLLCFVSKGFFPNLKPTKLFYSPLKSRLPTHSVPFMTLCECESVTVSIWRQPVNRCLQHGRYCVFKYITLTKSEGIFLKKTNLLPLDTKAHPFTSFHANKLNKFGKPTVNNVEQTCRYGYIVK